MPRTWRKHKMFKNLVSKIKNWFFRQFFTIEMTPRGEYFYRYLSKIVHEEWTEADYNQYYEETLEQLRQEHNITRIEAATLYYRYFKALSKKIEEWNGSQ